MEELAEELAGVLVVAQEEGAEEEAVIAGEEVHAGEEGAEAVVVMAVQD